MKYWFDTEFYERPGQLDLISIGIVAEDGRVYYAENKDFLWANIQNLARLPERYWSDTPKWLLRNVKPHMRGGIHERTPQQMKAELLKFFADDDSPEIWAYYADYDWVAFCWIFGRMIDLPPHFPKFCRDLKQWAVDLGNPQLPKQTEAEGVEHNALADARWNRHAWHTLDALQRRA